MLFDQESIYSFKSKLFKFDETLYTVPFQGNEYEIKP